MNSQDNQMEKTLNIGSRTPNLANPVLNSSLNIAHPNQNHRTIHQKINSFGGGTLMMTEIKKQNFVFQQSTTNQKKNNSGSGLNFDNLNWVFLKNDSSALKKHSHRQKKQKKKDLSTSFGGLGSDRSSLDSPSENKTNNNSAAGINDFEDIIQRHMRKEDPTINDDISQLQEHQNHYNVQDDDNPTQILEKISNQVHDNLCPGAPVGLLNISKVNQSSNKGNDSWDSKITDQSDRIPKINGVNALIKQQQPQNSARTAQVGGSSNFQSFKKNAMKLPKVAMRSSLLQQYTQQKTLSVPISPRVFDSAKFGQHSQKKSQNDSQNDINLSIGQVLNNNNSSGYQNPSFILPMIEKTQQSTYLETYDQSTSQGRTNPQQLQALKQEFENNFEINTQDQNNQVENPSVSFLTEISKVENNFKTRFTLNNMRGKILGSPQPIQNPHGNRNNHSNGSGKCGDQSIPALNNQVSGLSQTIGKSGLISLHNVKVQQSLNLSSHSNNIKCSSCHKQSHDHQIIHQNKKFSFESSHIEKYDNNISCFSDGQLQRDEESEELEASRIQSRLQRIIDRSLEGKIRKQSDTSLNEYDLLRQSGYTTVKDNKYFNKFAIKYNANLIKAFEEADRYNKVSLNSSVTLKNDALAYMEQHNEIRQQLKEEMLKNATPIGQTGKIMKISIKKQQLQQFINNNSNNNSNNPLNEKPDKKELNEYQKEAKIKFEKMKNYGRWYLKPNEFTRIIQNNQIKRNREKSGDDEGAELIYQKRNSSVL